MDKNWTCTSGTRHVQQLLVSNENKGMFVGKSQTSTVCENRSKSKFVGSCLITEKVLFNNFPIFTVFYVIIVQ